jgi:hypothetical protein
VPQKTLEYLRGITADEVRRLRERGILHTNHLLHAATLEIDRKTLQRRTGISPERLLEFAHQCALLEVSGMERYLPIVRRLGIDGLKTLKKQDAEELHAKLLEAVGLAGAPRLSDVQYWISQARAIDMIEEAEPAASVASPSVLDLEPQP